MTIEKNDAIVLSVMPFRESSIIATLFTKEHGRVSGIAKGIRKSAREGLTLERGLRTELFLHVKPHRDLHVIGQTQVIDYFPSIRANLNKLSVRDAAFEIVLKSVTSPGGHPELFAVLNEFLITLDSIAGNSVPLALLAHFYHDWASGCGFGLAILSCSRCGRSAAPEGGTFMVEQGTIVCATCLPAKRRTPPYVTGATIRFLTAKYSDEPPVDFRSGSIEEQFSLVNLLAQHCRYHFDIRYELKTIVFLQELLFENGAMR